MEITLTPELENIVNEEIESGRFTSPGEVLRESLLMFKESRLPKKIRLENLRREVQKGIDAIKRGNSTTYYSADEMVEGVIAEARSEFDARKRNDK